MSHPSQLSLLQQIDSLAIRTVGTEFHGAVLDLRSAYLSDFSIMRSVHCPDMVAVVLPIVAKQFGVDERLLKSPDRSRQVAHARHASMWILRNLGQLSYPLIASALERADHSTAMNGCRRIDAMRRKDSRHRAKTDALAQLCADAIERHVPGLAA